MIVFDQLKKNDPYLRTVTWGVLIGLVILFTGLWWVQVISHRQHADNQLAQSYRTVRIPAIRGKILDRHGAPLAENQPNFHVGIYLDELRGEFKAEWAKTRPRKVVKGRLVPASLKRPERLTLESAARYRVVSNIVRSIAHVVQEPVAVDYEEFRQHYAEQLALPLTVKSSLSITQVARLQEQTTIPAGVDVDMQPLRVYPGGALAAHVLGFLRKDNSSAEDEDAFFNFRLPDWRGRLGIEGAFDADLRGKAGVKSVLVNSLGYRQSETIWTPAEPGRNVVLTLDASIQYEAEAALRTHEGAQTRGAVVVLNPVNGDLLALVSSPAYDPNQFIPQISHEEYARLSDERLKPQVNRAIQENYAPGSIFKIVIALACLEAGLNPAEKIYNPGRIYVGRRVIDDLAGPGEYDFKRAFVKSSNTYFITNGLRAGIERIAQIGARLHLGEKADLPTGQEVSGFFPQRRHISIGWTPGDTANLCIGQGKLDVTPLQMAVMTAAIANGGKVLWPRLVDRVVPAEAGSRQLSVRFPPRPQRDELGVRPRTLQIIREAMLADVEDAEGTGRAGAVPGMRVCAKTGTAQVMNPQGHVIGHTTWFTSFAPYESPRYVVVVMIEGGVSGGGTCAPIAAQIYRAIQRLERRAAPTMAGAN